MATSSPSHLEHPSEYPKEQLIESLKFPNMYHRVNDIDSHLTNDQTCGWIVDHHYHQAWLNPNNYHQHKGVLSIRGKPGVGKSTIMRVLSKHLMGDDSRAVISFFFNARGDDLQKSPEGMYRYLLCQLLELPGLHVPERLYAPYKTSSSRTGWRLDELRNLFSDVIGIIRQRELICLIDALDECSDEAHSIPEYFQDLAQLALRNGVKPFICFSARHDPAISTGPGLTLILEKEPGHRRDLETYVNNNLDGINERDDADEIKTALLDKSDGVFLWVFLVVSQLNKDMRGDHSFEWEESLEEIPGDLFNGILTKDKDDASVLELSIQLILFSMTPLKFEQYYHAMVTESDPDARPAVSSKKEMKKYVQSSSKGLAKVTPKGFVQFIHESVRDFLTNPTKNGGVWVWWRYPESDFRACSHRRLAIVCCGYIQMWHGEILSDSMKLGDTEGVVEAFPFIEYALQYVWLHTAIVAPCLSEPYFPDQFEDVWISLYYSLGLADFDENKLAASLFYLFSGRPSAFHDIRNLCLTREYKPTLLSVAANGGHANLMHLLIDCWELQFDGNSSCVNVNEDVSDGTPLLVACSGPEYKGMIEPLLKGGFSVNSIGGHGLTPLLRAASWSHETVKLLLDYGAEVNVSCASYLTPLIIAIRFRQKETVRLLLSKGADVNATDEYDESPLFFAVRYGYSEILELLLNQKTAEVDKQNNLGETPLLIATSGIELQVLRQLLIDHGASDNSALKIVEEVIEGGDPKNVKNLLLGEPDKRWVEHFSLALGFWVRNREARMDVPSYEEDEKQDFGEWQWNAERNKEEMVKMLLKHGASVDIADNDGMTPLKLAAAWRNTKIEKLLQDRGATGSVVDNEDVMQID